jgi:hypothetical protein
MGASQNPVGGLPPLPAGAQLVSSGASASTTALPPLPAGAQLTSAPAGDPLTGNPNGEGTYQMQGPKGTVGVPYSNVETAQQQGYQLQGDTQSFFHLPTGDAARYMNDQRFDPKVQAQYAQGMAQQMHSDPGFGTMEGVARGAALTAAGLGHITQKIVGKVTGKNNPADPNGALAKVQQFGEGGDTGEEEFGKFVESAGEFLMGDEALKGMAYLDKVKQVLPVLKVLEKSPLLARTLDAAMQQSTVAGGQTLVKTGGDVGAAGESAALTAGTTGLLTAGLGSVGAAREWYAGRTTAANQSLKDYQEAMANYRQQVAERLTKTDAANADWKTQRDQQAVEHAQAMEGHNQALTDRSQQMEKARTDWKAQIDQQQAAHATAMEAYNQQLADRTAGNVQARTAWKAQLDEQAAKHAADVAEYQQQLADHNQTVASLKNEATTALKTQRQIEGQQGIKNIARDATQDGLTRFNEALGPGSEHAVDPVTAAQGVNTFGDGTNAWREAAKPVYDKINEATGNKFNELQQARSAAIRGQDFAEAGKAETKIDALLEKNPGVSPQEWRAAKSLWADSKDMDRIHSAVEGAFNGIGEEMAAQPGTGARIVKGETLQNRLGGVLNGPKKLTPERMTQLLGPDGLKGLYTAAHLTSTPELRAATTTLAQKVADDLQSMAPTAPVKTEPAAAPALAPKPAAPVKPGAPPAPEPLPKPVAPEKPAPVARPEPLPRVTRPTPPVRPSKTDSIARAIGGHTAEGVAGLVLGHATGIPYPYAIGGVAGTRYVLQQMVTNPKVGDMMKYAVDYGATPERAAKMIAMIISNAESAQQPQTTTVVQPDAARGVGGVDLPTTGATQ